jgi:hypothetical protein
VVFLKPLVERCFMHFRLRGGTVRLQPSCEQVRSVNRDHLEVVHVVANEAECVESVIVTQ